MMKQLGPMFPLIVFQCGSLTKSSFVLHHRSISRIIASTPRPEPGRSYYQPIGFCVNVRHFLVADGVSWRVITWIYQSYFHWSRRKNQWLVLPRHAVETTVAASHSCLVISSPSSRTVLQPTKSVRLLHCFSRDTRLHQPTGLATEQSRSQSGGLRDLGDSAGTSLPLPDPWHRPSERTTD